MSPEDLRRRELLGTTEFQGLRDLLDHGDLAHVDQGMELLRAMEDGELKELVLGMVTMESDGSLSGSIDLGWPSHETYVLLRLLMMKDETVERCERLSFSQDRGLESLPEEMGRFTSLKTLDLRGNRLESLPESFGELTSLERLDLSRNHRFAELPHFVGALRGLRELSIVYMDLTSLPESLGQLTNLERLLLNGNRLTGLPPSLAALKRLRYLSLADVDRMELPAFLPELSALRSINLCGVVSVRTSPAAWVRALAACPRLDTVFMSYGGPMDALMAARDESCPEAFEVIGTRACERV